MSLREIHIPAGQRRENPVEYVVTEDSDVLITVQQGVECTIVEQLQTKTDACIKTTLVLQENAHVEFVSIENSDYVKNTVSREFIVHKDAQLKLRSVLLGSATHTENRKTILQETGAATEERECFFGTKDQVFTCTTTISNNAPHTSANVLVKGVLGNRSRANCVGNMCITKAGDKSSSWLAQHVLLLSKEAKADTLPCLEIEANDVQAYHAATVRALDDEQLFYLTTRGFTQEQAKELLARSVLQEITVQISNKELQRKTDELIEAKWKELYAEVLA